MSENVHEVWSDDELDRALATLNAEVPPGDVALAKARAELMGASGAPQAVRQPKARRHWGRWAAAVAVIAASFTALQVVPFGDEPSLPTAAAGELLTRAADKIGASDPVVGPGQYLYIEEHDWGGMGALHPSDPAKGWFYLDERFNEKWVPADRTQEWLWRKRETGNRKWIVGGPNQVPPMPGSPMPDRRARCGDFIIRQSEKPCEGPGSWYRPTPEFLASLPTDPRQLHDLIRKEVSSRSHPPEMAAEFTMTGMLQQVLDLAKPGVAPADIRANLYRALALTPGLVISDRDAVNLDGRKGVALGLEAEGVRWEMIVDPETGQYIGSRQTQLEANSQRVPVGTVTSTAVRIGVVANMGDKPRS
ncbi:CU044_5270 family protein [Kibdelosporangium phytohabitans]|uniref:Uncharacterized protein n=1 Tax=Kibdelosporangium phytohabitans TaxID=860235 RepID=A0A0N9HV49_9PSEU|nr:CU044_5270 family protein [Kibdelosporangium phytohabitans]ALG05928.1 hypothetical protein AOZ06_02435 [Kibdelosporangium phytohabitans]MBE1466023.1 hypothetical protein [Kibdelosporangium phytohabitans]